MGKKVWAAVLIVLAFLVAALVLSGTGCSKKKVKKAVPVEIDVRGVTISTMVGRFVDVTPLVKIEVKQPVVKKVAEKKLDFETVGDKVIINKAGKYQIRNIIKEKLANFVAKPKPRVKRQIKTQVIKSVAPVIKTKTFGIPRVMWILLIIFFCVGVYLIYRGGKRNEKERSR